MNQDGKKTAMRSHCGLRHHLVAGKVVSFENEPGRRLVCFEAF